ncbi:hypothetical protein [Kluyvera cryocrescens]|uniref:hypothetical protein n=1 Tax=Kluyvera cryocrescens TaxID=580 RepID=UPI002DB820F6|nr:hypothetical protein [Kluyvera cryocrescens]MEB6631173.1 hypothetical protein [Kluyvera cryocrescens]
MAKKKNRKGKINVVQKQKDRLRGLIGEARGFESYKDRKENKKDKFDSKFTQSLFEARENLPVASQEKYLDWADKMVRDLLPNKTKISRPSWRTLSFINESKIISFKAEISWLITRIKKKSKKINEFLQLKKDIEASFIKNDYDSLIEYLNNLDHSQGYSLWSLETRLGITQHFKGLEAQKKAYNDIKNQAGIGFIRFIAYRLSMRNEPAVSLPRFKQSISSLLNEEAELKDLPIFIKYKLTGITPLKELELLSILRFSQNLSDIDCYETLIEITQCLSAHENEKCNYIIDELRYIGIHDFRLQRLFNEKPHNSELTPSLVNNENLFNGNGKSTLKSIVTKIKHGKASPFDIIILSIVRKNKKNGVSSTQRNIFSTIRDLTTINTKGPGFLLTLHNLEKELLNLSTISFCRALLDGVRSLKGTDVFSLITTFKKIALNNQEIHFLNFLSSTDEINIFYNKIKGREYPNTEILLNVMDCKISDEASFIYLTPNKIFLSFCNIILNFKSKKYPTCLKDIEDLKLKYCHPELWNKISHIEIISLFETGNVEKSISLMARNICDDNFPNEIIETCDIISNKTTWPEIRKYANDLSLSILLDHLSEVTASDSIATLRRTSIDNYLKIHNLSKPSDIISMPLWNNENSRKLIYFYKQICTTNVLEMCRCLKSGTSDVEKERASILAILIQLDGDNGDMYQDEILSITSDLRIREGLKVVDESRLYVNQEGLLRWAKLEQSEDILRYKNFVDAGIGDTGDISDFLQLKDNSIDTEKKVLQVPENEADELLYQLFCDLKDAFLFENEHGLNSYLSKRIRHNSIAGFLRGAVENENLVTLKDSRKKYLLNTYWKERLDNIYPELVVDKSLRELEIFGSSFDNTTHFIRDELIQIKSLNKPTGGIFINQEQMIILFHIARSFMKKNKYEVNAWVEVATTLFWHMLEPSLSELRASLSNEYKSIFQTYFDTLKQNLIKHAGMDISGHEIFNSINNASSELYILLDRASEWLKKGQSELSKNSYSLNEILDIAIRAALVRHKGCNINVNKSIDKTIELRADSLVVLSDIILIVIGNISEHSGLRKSAELSITANFTPDRSKLAFSFKSKVSPGKDNYENNLELEKIRKKIASNDYVSNIAIEGKSGLIKIASIVQPHASGYIDFGFLDVEHFYINIEMPYTGKSDVSYQSLEVSDEYFAN